MADESKRPSYAEPDEIVTSGQRAMVWIERNASLLVYAGGALLFIALMALGFMLVRNNQISSANLALLDAVNIVQPLAERENQPALSDSTAPARYREGLSAFREVAGKYASLPQGKAATLYAANALFNLGSFQEAISALEGLSARDPEFVLRYGGSYLLGKSYEAGGDFQRALAVYAQVRDRSRGDMRGQVMVDMARCSRLSGDNARAAEMYQSVLAEFPPGTPLGQRAEKMLALLGANGQKPPR